MASTPHGYPNILKNTELLLIIAAAIVSATRYILESVDDVLYTIAFKEPEKNFFPL
ncbi:hypothetical protein AVEN_86185-1, partial [Araneus ventricosus]